MFVENLPLPTHLQYSSQNELFDLKNTLNLGKTTISQTANKKKIIYPNITAVAVNHDLNSLIIVYSDRTTVLWKRKDKATKWQQANSQILQQSHNDTITDLFSIETILYTVSYDGTLKLWNTFIDKFYCSNKFSMTNQSVLNVTQQDFNKKSRKKVSNMKENKNRDIISLPKDLENNNQIKLSCIKVNTTNNLIAIGDREGTLRYVNT